MSQKSSGYSSESESSEYSQQSSIPDSEPSSIGKDLDFSDLMRNRIENSDIINKLLDEPDGSFVCPSNQNLLSSKVLLVKHIGSPSINGEVWQSCTFWNCDNNKCSCTNKHTVALKKIPLTPEAVEHLEDYYYDDVEAMKFDVFAEIMCMHLCKVLVENNVCPNLPVFFKYYFCEDCKFSNPSLVKYFKHAKMDQVVCALLLTEYASLGDLKNWLKEKRSVEEWFNMFFQVFVGLYALQKYFDLTHNDLHWGNVLVHKIKPGGYFKYTIDGTDYYLPNIGLLFVLWDFGYAHIPNKLEPKPKNATIKNRLSVDANRIMKVIDWLPNEYGIDAPKEIIDFVEDYQRPNVLLHDIFNSYDFDRFRTPPPQNDIIKTFSLDKKIKIGIYEWFLKDRSLNITSSEESESQESQKNTKESFLKECLEKDSLLMDTLAERLGIKETDRARLCEQIVKTFKSENKERNN
jgi:hypothetical protein